MLDVSQGNGSARQKEDSWPHLDMTIQLENLWRGSLARIEERDVDIRRPDISAYACKWAWTAEVRSKVRG